MPMNSAWDDLPTKARRSQKARPRFDGEAGLPHSEIPGSKVAHTSPGLIAACHVLHRLCMPRHPPNALTSHLRVHITNRSAAGTPATRSDQRIDLSREATSGPKAGCHLTASIEKPIHDVKDQPPERKLSASSLKDATSATPAVLVEPAGIEPATSSLQS